MPHASEPEKNIPYGQIDERQLSQGLLRARLRIPGSHRYSIHSPAGKLELIKNKEIGTRGQGEGVWCPRELTTEQQINVSLRLSSCFAVFGQIFLKYLNVYSAVGKSLCIHIGIVGNQPRS